MIKKYYSRCLAFLLVLGMLLQSAAGSAAGDSQRRMAEGDTETHPGWTAGCHTDRRRKIHGSAWGVRREQRSQRGGRL